MKITIDRSTLLDRLSQVTKAISLRSAVPIMDCVLIESNATLTLTGSDGIFTASTTLDDYKEHAAGSAAIPGKKLTEVISSLPDKPVTIDADDSRAIIQCGSKKVVLPAVDPEDFPRKALPEGEPITMDIADFIRMVEGTRFAASTNEQTPILTGINVKQQEGEIVVTATDRHRLAKQIIAADGATVNAEHTIPAKPLAEIVKTAKGKTNEVEIRLSDSQAFVRAGAFNFIATMQDGTYPDTSKIIPREPKTTVLVDKDALLQTLELAATVSDSKMRIASFVVTASELQVSAKNEGSNMEETLEAEVTGEEMKLSANSKYLVDALKQITTKRAEIWLIGPMSPILIYGEGDRSSMHLVLPYRTTG